MTPKTTLLRKLLSPLLLLPLALSACTDGTDTPLSPIDPILPGQPGNDGTGSVTVSFSAAAITPYGAQTPATRTGGKVLLSQQITIEDTWPDSLTARTRAPGYVPTPIAQVTLTEEPAPAGTRASSNMDVGKSFLLLAYEINALNEYTCVLWCIATVQSDYSILYSSVNGVDDAKSDFLNLSKGKYRFVAYYMPESKTSYDDMISSKKSTDFPWDGPITLNMIKASDFPFGGNTPDTPEGHEVYLYDSGEVLITGNTSFNITFQPAFAKVLLHLDYPAITSARTDFAPDKVRIFLAPPVLYDQDLTWTPSGQSVSYQPYVYPTGGTPSKIGNVNLSFTSGLQYASVYEYLFITPPLADAPLKIPFQNTTDDNATKYVYFPEITTRATTLEAGKFYTLKIIMSDLARRIQDRTPSVNGLWWMSGCITKDLQVAPEKWLNRDSPYYGNYDKEITFDNICSELDRSLYGTGWRLPTINEVGDLGTDLIQNPHVSSDLYNINTTIPMLSFYDAGYWYSNSVIITGSTKYKSEEHYGIYIPIVYPHGIYEIRTGKLIGEEKENLKRYGLYNVKCVK